MPTFRQHIALAIRNLKVFLNLEVGVVRNGAPGPDLTGQETTVVRSYENGGTSQQQTPQQNQKLRQLRQELEEKDRQNAQLRAQLAAGAYGPPGGGVKPENIVWMFGIGRSGSSWLSAMVGDLKGYARWNEPYVGEIFGTAYYHRAGDRMRGRKDYILGDPYKEARANSIRNFILEGANARFPEVAEKAGYLFIKEPNGSMGAPLLMEALSKSRMIFLIRDPRDVISSALSANKKGSWGNQWRADGSDAPSLADTDPDTFVRQWADIYMGSVGSTKEAYDAHPGLKTVVKYEDLRADALGTMKSFFAALELPVDKEGLAWVVEKHSWENVPEEQKGPDKPRRKAKPGGWQEDLTPVQARIIEEIDAPILDGFYPGWVSSGAAGG